jgi:hypothetical protein
MTRSFFAVLVVGVAGLAMVPAYLQGCNQTGVGDPCTPEQEYDPSFLGFAAGEVNVESKSFDCQTRLCLANHFQGRVTCPYGQDKNGKAITLNGSNPYTDKNGAPIGGCVLPGGGQDQNDGTPPSGQAVTGTLGTSAPNPTAQVPAQCLDRTGGTGGTAVYCSCRCQNVNGKTDDGAVYCACPDGFSCKQLVSPIGTGNEGLTGAYCVKNNTDYDPLKSTCGTGAAANLCDPAKASAAGSDVQKACGTFNGQ